MLQLHEFDSDGNSNWTDGGKCSNSIDVGFAFGFGFG